MYKQDLEGKRGNGNRRNDLGSAENFPPRRGCGVENKWVPDTNSVEENNGVPDKNSVEEEEARHVVLP